MKKFLLTNRSNLALFRRTVCVLIIILGLSGNANAQCVGPYQVYESFRLIGLPGPPATGMRADGWTFSAAAPTLSSSATQARTGANSLVIGGTTRYIQTPLLASPKDFSFYYRNNVTTYDITLKVDYSTTLDFSSFTTLSTKVTRSNLYESCTVDLSALSNVYVRITLSSSILIADGITPGTAGNSTLFIDDIAWTSRTNSQNTIVVPELGNSTCNPVIVPAAGTGVLKFYDQGGLSDNYSSPRTYTALSATSSGLIVNGSTTNLVVGMYLAVQSGTGAFAPGTVVTAITSATSFTINNFPTTPLVGAVIFGTLVTTPYFSATGASSIGNTITVNNTANLVVGMSIFRLSGTGAFAPGTIVTNIINTTSFTVSVAPTTQLSGAVVRGTLPQSQIVVFKPATPSEKVRLTFVNSFALDASANITVYNGNGAIAGNEFGAANAYTSTSTLPGALQSPVNSFTSANSGDFITVKFNSAILPPLAGFDVNVECVADLSIASLSASSGCSGTSFTVTGTGFTNTAMSATVGGSAATATYFNATTVTITPTTVASGPVVLTNGGTATSLTNYTVNASPIVSAGASVCVGSTITISPATGGTWLTSDATKATVDNFGTVTGVAAGSPTFTFTNSSTGCSATTPAVTVNALPVVSAGPSVCVGSTIDLLPTTGGTWSSSDNTKATVTNAGVATGIAVGNVTFTFTSTTTNCSASTSSVSVLGRPTITLTTTAPQSYCLNTTTVTPLSVTATTSVGSITFYQWYSNTIPSTSGSPSAVGTNSSTYIPSTLSLGILYYYCVVTNTAGCTATSAVSGAITVANVPATPTLLSTNPIGGSIFTANWNPVLGATGYLLDVSTASNFSSFISGYFDLPVGNVTSYTVSGLAQGGTYYYRVRAINSCGLGQYATSTAIGTSAFTYCIPNVPPNTTSFINSFTTSSGISNISNLNTGFTPGGYANYTTQSCSQYPSSSINYTITSLATFTTDQTFFYFIWVDWNDNGIFTDAGETMLNSSATYIASPFSGSFRIPAGQAAGSYRMRVSSSWFGANLPCTQSARSETEDYTFRVVAVPPCVPSNPSALVASGVFANGATISWTDAAMTPNSVYNYYISDNATAPLISATPSGSVIGSLSANVGGLILGTTYYFWVRSNCGTPNPWQGLGSFTTENFIVVNMNNGNTTACNVRFYDSGGSANTYSNNEFYTHTFNAPLGKALKIVFNSFNTESGWDGLLIYKGSNLIPSGLSVGFDPTTCPQDSFYDTTSPGTIYSDINGSITFVFRSDGSAFRNGWDASVTCVTLPVITDFFPIKECAGTVREITINGSNFTGATTVSFNGVSVTPISVDPNQIKVNLPLTATTGFISVTTSTVDGVATGTSSSMFTITPIPPTPSAGSDFSVCLGTSVGLLGSSTAVISTTVLSENFNGGTWPSTWVRTNNGSVPPGDFRTTFESNASGNNGFGLGYTGFCSYFYSFSITSGVSGDMISPAMNLSSYSSGSLSFWIFNSSGTDNLKVFANNNNGAYTQIGTTYVTYGSWTQITISLNNFVGTGFNNVKIKFTGTSDFGLSNIAVDDIVVTGNIAAPIAWSPSTYLNSTTSLTPNVTPTAAMPSPFTYSLTTTVNGCSSLPDNVVVTVTSRPTALITGTQSVCSGNTANVSIALTGTGPWRLTYSNGSASTTVNGITASPYTFTTPAITSAINYTVVALDDAVCSAVPLGMTGSAAVTINAAPTITLLTTAAAAVCYNNNSQFTTLAYSAITGSPVTYSVVWGAGIIPAGFAAMTDTTFPNASSGTISIAVPAGADNTVLNTATLILKNAQGCVSASYPFTLVVNRSPTLTITTPSSSITTCYSTLTQGVSYSYENAVIANVYDVTWASPSNGLPNISNAPFTSSTGNISITVPANTPGGTYTGTITPKNAGCGPGPNPRIITLIISQPSITPEASSAPVCITSGAQTTTLPYSNSTGTPPPTSYSITWSNAPSNTFAPVTNATLNASAITINIPAGTTANTYTGTISVRNSIGCVSPGINFTVIVNGKPEMASTFSVETCPSGSAQTASLAYTTSTNAPTSYSIDWNAAATSAGLADQGLTTAAFVASNGSITSIVVPANLPLNQYSGDITIRNANGCFNSYPITMYAGKVWNGSTSTAWSTPSNWSPSGLPTLSDNCVAIPSGTPFSPVINANAVAGTLTINSGATLTVNGGSTLEVQDFVKTNGTLIFENNASLVQTNNVANTGNITYRRTTNMRKFDFTYWSSPVAGESLFDLSPTTLPDKYFSWNATANVWDNVPSSTIMAPGKGYIVRGPQGSDPLNFTSFTGSFIGVPNNGDYSVDIIKTAANDINLIGNPYPSAVNAISFLSGNSTVFNGGTTLYFWTHNTPVTNFVYSGSDYAMWNLSGGTGVGGPNNTVPDGKIAAGQGFMIKAINIGTQQATFRNNMRVVGNNTNFYRPQGAYNNERDALLLSQKAAIEGLERHRIWLDLTNDQGLFKEVLLAYVENATNNYEEAFDGDAADNGSAVGFYSLQSTHKLGIQGRALPFDVTDIVPLGLQLPVAGSYTIQLSNFDGLFADISTPVYLEDQLLHVVHNLRQGAYTFVSEAGTFDDRFVIRFTNDLLQVADADFNENSVVVFNNKNTITVQSSSLLIKEVQLYDVRGRLIMAKNNLKTDKVIFENLAIAQQVLLVQITTENGSVVVKKIIF